jgi:hypothetical protein
MEGGRGWESKLNTYLDFLLGIRKLFGTEIVCNMQMRRHLLTMAIKLPHQNYGSKFKKHNLVNLYLRVSSGSLSCYQISSG